MNVLFEMAIKPIDKAVIGFYSKMLLNVLMFCRCSSIYMMSTHYIKKTFKEVKKL